jgi:hypothetical protein
VPRSTRGSRTAAIACWRLSRRPRRAWSNRAAPTARRIWATAWAPRRCSGHARRPTRWRRPSTTPPPAARPVPVTLDERQLGEGGQAQVTLRVLWVARAPAPSSSSARAPPGGRTGPGAQLHLGPRAEPSVIEPITQAHASPGGPGYSPASQGRLGAGGRVPTVSSTAVLPRSSIRHSSVRRAPSRSPRTPRSRHDREGHRVQVGVADLGQRIRDAGWRGSVAWSSPTTSTAVTAAVHSSSAWASGSIESAAAAGRSSREPHPGGPQPQNNHRTRTDAAAVVAPGTSSPRRPDWPPRPPVPAA